MALCYKATGRSEDAIEVILTRFKEGNYTVGIYDYIHLGVLYLEKGEFSKAQDCFKKQEKLNDLAENRYYLALVNKKLKEKDEYVKNLNKAKELYHNNLKMHDVYQDTMDKIYLSTILTEEQRGY